ncbi:MAG: NUDIX domain-containing protein [Cyclobacteriaceae bacterium]|nr:NUDIX domain-containing protein [Cyclobacteriaceae bacterium]
MKLFLNSIPVQVKKMGKAKDFLEYDVIINGGNKNIYVGMLVGDVLINNASLDQLDRMFNLMARKRLQKLKSITFTVDDRKSVKHFVKQRFKIIKAGGGVVTKRDQILMIYRLNKWDLPKGKLDKDEDWAEGAVREVQEECNIKVKLKDRICATWHSYSMNGKKILKQTTWFVMECKDDSAMKPQISEDIHAVEWKQGDELTTALFNTYPSVKYVIERFFAMPGEIKEADKVKSR